jgi:hypothetical protein
VSTIYFYFILKFFKNICKNKSLRYQQLASCPSSTHHLCRYRWWLLRAGLAFPNNNSCPRAATLAKLGGESRVATTFVTPI